MLHIIQAMALCNFTHYRENYIVYIVFIDYIEKGSMTGCTACNLQYSLYLLDIAYNYSRFFVEWGYCSTGCVMDYCVLDDGSQNVVSSSPSQVT